MAASRAQGSRPVSWPWVRRAWRPLWVSLVSAGALGFILLLLDVYRVGGMDADGVADAAVVLGAAQWNGRPSPVYRARLDHAAELWQAQRVRWVVVTGGMGSGDTVSEAEVGARYLAQAGIPSGRLVVAPVGASTLASLRAAAESMRANDLQSALLVSDPYHMKRALRMASDLGLRVDPAPARDGPFADAPAAVLRQSSREVVGFAMYVALGV